MRLMHILLCDCSLKIHIHISKYLFPNFSYIDFRGFYFQFVLDLIGIQTSNLLKVQFVNKIISRDGPVNLPPRFCNSTSMDYFYRDIKSPWFTTDPLQRVKT